MPWLTLPCVPPAFLLWDPTKVPPRLQDVTNDHIRMHKVLQDSGLKYVAVMPPHIGEWGQDPAARSPTACPLLPSGDIHQALPGPSKIANLPLTLSILFPALFLFSFLTYLVISVEQITVVYDVSVPRAD